MFARGKRIAARCSRAMHLQCRRHEDPLPLLLSAAFHPAASPAPAATTFPRVSCRIARRCRCQGVNGDTYKDTSALEPDMTVIEALDYQPEFRSPISGITWPRWSMTNGSLTARGKARE